MGSIIKLLELAPEIQKKELIGIPNLYVYAVDRILSNIRYWIDDICNENLIDFLWLVIHFVELKRRILYEYNTPQISDHWLS